MAKDVMLFNILLLLNSAVSWEEYDCRKGVFNNRILHNGECKACPAGLNGPNCTFTCPYGYHGSECASNCKCSEDQFCHFALGCGYLSVNGGFSGNSTDMETALKEEQCVGQSEDFSPWIYFITASSTINFIILCIISCNLCTVAKR